MYKSKSNNPLLENLEENNDIEKYNRVDDEKYLTASYDSNRFESNKTGSYKNP